MTGPTIITELSITHDEVVALINESLAGTEIPLTEDDVSTLAHHIRGLAALAQKIQPHRDCGADIKNLVPGIADALTKGWQDGAAAAAEEAGRR